jgi:hypothetical protein
MQLQQWARAEVNSEKRDIRFSAPNGNLLFANGAAACVTQSGQPDGQSQLSIPPGAHLDIG